MTHAPKKLVVGGIFEDSVHTSPKDQEPIPKEGYVDPRYADVKRPLVAGGPGSGPRSHGEFIHSLSDKRRDRKAKSDAGEHSEQYHAALEQEQGLKTKMQQTADAAERARNSGNHERAKELTDKSNNYNRQYIEAKNERKRLGKKIGVNEAAEKAPPGWEGTVKKMKKHKDIDNPFALAWSMKNKGFKSHESKTKESASFDDDAPRPIDLKTLYQRPAYKPGWNGQVYSPALPRRESQNSNLIIKEF